MTNKLDRFIVFHNELVVNGKHSDKDREDEYNSLKKEIEVIIEQLDKINNFVGHITLEELLVELEQYKSVIDDIRKLKFHDMPIPQDSTSFTQFSRKQSKLKSILKEVEK